MKIWGGWLPYIGWRDEWVDRFQARELFGYPIEARYKMETDEVLIRSLDVEWLECGIMLAARPML